MLSRITAFLYGVVCYLAFFATFLYAIGFLGNFAVPKSIDSGPQSPFIRALAINAAMLGLFAFQHSNMARQWFKAAWTRIVPATVERSTYVLFSSLALLLLFWKWEPMGGVVWSVENTAGRLALNALFAAGWLTVLVATFLINHFDLFGLRQVWLYLLGRPYTSLKFRTPGLYRLVRHPLYVGWLMVFWSAPLMTAAHLVFAIATTAYILIAIQFEERDLVRAHAEYGEYPAMCGSILQSGNSCGRRAKIGLRNSHSNYGVPPPSGSGVIRPILPQPGHDAQGRSWQPDRSASAKGSACRRKQCFYRFRISSVPRSVGILASVERMSADAVEAVVREAQKRGDLIGVRISIVDDAPQDPWALPPSQKSAERPVPGPFPPAVQIVHANLLYIEKNGLPPAMLNRLLRLAAFQNPEFYKAQAMRLPTFNKPRIIACGEDLANHIALPRGCLVEVMELFEAHHIKPDIRDERCAGHSIDVKFCGQLRPSQQDAVSMIAEHDEGVLCAPTAFGKTAVAAWLIAARKVNTLVLVHRQQLLDQWHARLAMFLDLSAKLIGQVGGGKSERNGTVDIAIIQSTHGREGVKDFVAVYGHVIVDECHHLSAFTFEQVMKQVKARYILGLTATPERKDRHHPIIYMQCGPIRHKLSARSMTAVTPFEHEVIPRLTEFCLPPEQIDTTIQEVYAALADDRARNELILADLLCAVGDRRSPLLLTGRTNHLKYFETALSGKVSNVFVLRGGTGKKQRRTIAEAIAAVPESEPRVILATGSYIGEGFDDARLDTLFLAMPISWRGTLQQYVGRLHRLHDAKHVVRVYDYVDCHVLMLARMYARRLKGYGAIGYRIGAAAADAPSSSD